MAKLWICCNLVFVSENKLAKKSPTKNNNTPTLSPAQILSLD